MWIDWDLAAAIALILAVGVALTRTVEGGSLSGVRTTARELALVLFLYAVWQWAHDLTVTKVDGARENALWLYDLQHDLHIPDELTLQRAVLDHGWLVQLFNGYYAIVHVPALIALLIWLFWRHRDHYGRIRNALALTTMACLFVHAIPMAPPRMFPELGFVDTGLVYEQSVYGRGGSGLSNQLAAMPSVHVAWALIVGLGAVMASSSRWRWFVLLHPVTTVVAVTVTANHWYGDGIVAGGILALSLLVVWGAERAWAGLGLPTRSVDQPGDVEPELQPA